MNQNNSIFFTSFKLLFYRCYLTLKNVKLYIFYPTLLFLELLYLTEEALAYLISIVIPIKQKPHELYGTISFSSIETLFKTISLSPQGIVCDLGSGKGKFLLYCMLVHKCKTIGIESNRYYNFIYGVFIRFFFKHSSCELIKSDIISQQIPCCDLLFISGLCFHNSTLEFIQNELNTRSIKPIFISVGVQFNLQNYKQEIIVETDLSWGKEKVFIYEPKK